MSHDSINDINYYLCQFCLKESDEKEWKEDRCPKCGRKYDFMLVQDGEE